MRLAVEFLTGYLLFDCVLILGWVTYAEIASRARSRRFVRECELAFSGV